MKSNSLGSITTLAISFTDYLTKTVLCLHNIVYQALLLCAHAHKSLGTRIQLSLINMQTTYSSQGDRAVPW